MALFGGMPFPVQFFLAFVIVLGLIGATAWAVRRFGTGRLGAAGMRGRQPRLAVIDYANVDARRRLILVRRDNVEHLLMIGGLTDIVVEPNIVRAVAAPREVTVPRPPAAVEMLPRTMPLPEDAASGSWPLQPESTVAAGGPRPPRTEPSPERPAAWPLQAPAETPTRAQRNTLAALADELSTRPVAPRSRPGATTRPHPLEQRLEPHVEPRTEVRMPTEQPETAEPAADQSLAEMAHRLEAALRKPSAKADGRDAREPRAPAAAPRAAPPAEHAPPPEAAPPPPSPPPPASPPARAARDATPPRADATQPTPAKALYDSLEQEMASLLGRPTSKT
jgi:flagellar protein FliO/FliZ